MYKEDYERQNYADRNPEDVYSKPVRAGKRTYFFDVKSTRDNGDYYLTVTESKRRQEQNGGFVYDKHKIFLYKEDFDKFQEGLAEIITYMRTNLLKDLPGEGERETVPAQKDFEDPASKAFTDVDFEEL